MGQARGQTKEIRKNFSRGEARVIFTKGVGARPVITLSLPEIIVA